jgi:hypothetical protein
MVRAATQGRRGLGCYLLVCAGLLLPGGLFLQARLSDRITAANCERIREGMSLADVEAVLGGPAGTYAGFRPCYEPPSRENLRSVPIGPIFLRSWTGETGTIVVAFGPDETVLGARFEPADYAKMTRGWLEHAADSLVPGP